MNVSTPVTTSPQTSSRRRLDCRTSASLDFRHAGEEEAIELPAGAVRLLIDILETMAAGRGLTLVPENAELSPSADPRSTGARARVLTDGLYGNPGRERALSGARSGCAPATGRCGSLPRQVERRHPPRGRGGKPFGRCSADAEGVDAADVAFDCRVRIV